MNEIVSIIQNASPVLAAAIIALAWRIRSNSKDIDTLRKRIDEYDALKISTQLAAIQTDLAWIKEKLNRL